ncbi:MAG TPA: DRTGG domain-containing protein [Oscillospiraceae bacterium]|nr:DRTGG domain-containing protein [Oscillospiraceae bacterium]HPF56919.1 DRTGG domain-containing protein [Clostridiales bacterium]HPK35289.1 DRTGG domain-containing protein [Oscillospiraceae bacterium]HPR76937.1 DRTGG domain-containing protein [Oscillospiraceae bacterium]
MTTKLTTSAYIQALGLETVCAGEDRVISGCYIGDLLSWVMGRASAGQVWLTVMSNTNVAAVASMTDVSCVVLCESAKADPELIERAKKLGLPILRTDKSAYDMAVETHELLK